MVSRSIDKFISTSNYDVVYDSPFGRHSNDFTVGQEIVVFADKDVAPAPLSHWKCNDNAANKIVVDSKAGNTGTSINNTSTLTGVGKINEALSFNGTTDRIDATYIPNQSVAFSFAAWIKVGDLDTTQVIYNNSNGTNDRAAVSIDTSGRIRGSYFDGSHNGRQASDNIITAGTFIHVVYTYDGSSGNIYLDGGVNNETSVLSPTNANATALNLGSGNGSNFFTGAMDDVRIYDKALTANQIAFIYNLGTGTESDDGQAITKIITGVVERVQFKGRGNSQTVRLKGRDYTLRLQDSTVDPIVYTDSEISTIVTDIINDNVDDITVTNVNATGTTLKRIVFNHTSVYEALRQLAELAGFYFYVDNEKDLHFEERDITSSGIVLDNTNINSSIMNQSREGMANDVTVYGDRQLAGFQEDFTANGTGSVFTLSSSPRNTAVNFSGTTSVPKIGGVLELTSSPVSGTTAAEFLVSFNDKQIVFISGTELGYSKIPPNLTIVEVRYDRDIPIVKTGVNRASINLYGRKEKIINDKNINDPSTATAILKSELLKSDPFRGVECDIKGWFDIIPGNTARVTLANFNIDEDIGILEIQYRFDKNKVNSEKVIAIKLDTKIQDIVDEITDIRNRVNAIEEADRQSTDVLTRLESSSDTLSVVGSSWYVLERTNLGSSFMLGVAPHGVTGPTWGGNLGSIIGSGINFLGDSRNALAIVQSGGFYT